MFIKGYHYYSHISNLFSSWYLDIFGRVYVKEVFALNKLHIIDLESVLRQPSRALNLLYNSLS